MASYFLTAGSDYLGNAGSDSNDGLDVAGFGLSGATFTNSTKKLNKTGAFAGYAWQANDRVYISGGTGVTTGLYRIAGKDSDDQIELVDDIGGTDPTDVTSSSGPFLTVQKLWDTVAIGDSGCICGGTTMTIDATVDWDLNSYANTQPSLNSPAGFIGVNSRGHFDGTIAEIRVGTFASATTVMFQCGSTSQDNFIISNLTINGARTAGSNDGYRGIVSTVYGASDNWRFVNFEVKNLTNIGVYGRFTNAIWRNSSAHHNGSHGVATSNSATEAITEGRFCSFHHNGGAGVHGSRSEEYQYCLFYRNTGNGYTNIWTSANAVGRMINCTLAYNGGDGYDGSAYATDNQAIILEIVNCVSANNGGYGFNVPAIPSGYDMFWELCRNNHTYGNTSGGWSNERGADTNTTGDPLFTVTTDESENFMPADGSPLIGAAEYGSIPGGVGEFDIGAIQFIKPTPSEIAAAVWAREGRSLTA